MFENLRILRIWNHLISELVDCDIHTSPWILLLILLVSYGTVKDIVDVVADNLFSHFLDHPYKYHFSSLVYLSNSMSSKMDPCHLR